MLAVKLEPPSCKIIDESGAVRVLSRQTNCPRLINVSYNQIIPYGKNDMAVSLRLLRALQDIASQTDYFPYLAEIRKHAQRVTKACNANFSPEDCEELNHRFQNLESRTEKSLIG
jgi:uncharacterized membrane protein